MKTKDIKQAITDIVEEKPICGNNVCQQGESPATCFQDCPFDVDQLICPIVKTQGCPSWVFSWFVYGLVATVVVATIRRQRGGNLFKR